MPVSNPKILIVILIQLVIASIHAFRLGQIFDGPMYNLYYSYFSDLILPFGTYFLLAINDSSIPILRPWYVKAGVVFLTATFAEICQLLGFEVLGVTFDVIDILMYGSGALIAAFVDVKILAANFGFWTLSKPSS